ncbi:MAG: type II secretion system F family protein [Terriglobales bacterium]
MLLDAFLLLALLGVLGLGWHLAAGGSRALGRLQEKLQPATPTAPPPGKRGLLIRSERLSDIPLLHRWLQRRRMTLRLQHWLEQAGMTIRPGKFLLVCAGAAVFADLIASCFVPWFGILPAVVLAAWLPWWWVARRRRQRLRAFQNQLPEALDLFVRASRAGHPPAAILELIAEETPEPLAGGFRRVWDEQRFGLSLRECWEHLSERVPLVEVKFLATAMIIQRESGGNLAEILEKLARVMRERVKVKRQILTHTAQARMTMWSLAALAPLLLLALGTISPQFIQPLFTDPLGRMMLAIGAGMQGFGLLLLMRIVEIKV